MYLIGTKGYYGFRKHSNNLSFAVGTNDGEIEMFCNWREERNHHVVHHDKGSKYAIVLGGYNQERSQYQVQNFVRECLYLDLNNKKFSFFGSLMKAYHTYLNHNITSIIIDNKLYVFKEL